MSDERDTPNNPMSGDDAEGGPAPLGPTEIPDDSPASDSENALSEQARRMHERRDQSDS